METVLITGANRGIGLEISKLYVQSDRHVLATCRNPQSATELNGLSKLGDIDIFQLELTDVNSVSTFCKSLTGQTIDILINNAGVLGSDKQTIDNMDYSDWIHTFSVNTIAPFQLSTCLKENLQLSGRPRIVSISSQMGSLNRKSKGSYAYRSSKAALNKVMQVLALDFESDGIIVCPVHPGWVQTAMGGEHADITAKESATGIIKLIDSLAIDHSGQFLTWKGERHPW